MAEKAESQPTPEPEKPAAAAAASAPAPEAAAPEAPAPAAAAASEPPPAQAKADDAAEAAKIEELLKQASIEDPAGASPAMPAAEAEPFNLPSFQQVVQ
ncbi:MAG TPA: hypothetical protein VL992_11610, partial [Tepidisphaeraceae bacterium]|nr:hypothetical protein [Tepidisphaeraceae bacterium]